MYKMSSIERYENFVKTWTKQFQFIGKNEDGNPIYDENKNLPKIEFAGYIKLHGTNGGIYFDGDNIQPQSKNNVLSEEKDNAGFYKWIIGREDVLLPILKNIYTELQAPFVIFGEFCGQSIQQKVAISQIPKTFFAFELCKVENDIKVHLKNGLDILYRNGFINEDKRLHLISEYPTYKIEVDFNNPQDVQSKLEELTLKVEKTCPVGLKFGINDWGEGLVWYGYYEDQLLRFKTKGDEHRKVNKKREKTLDIDNQLIVDVAKKVTPEWRLGQMLQESFDTINGGEVSIKGLGNFLKAVFKDIDKEEQHTLKENNLTMKQINKEVSKISKEWFFNNLKG